MNKAFTIIETLLLLFIISIMLNLSLNLLYFDRRINNTQMKIEEGE